MILCSVTYLLFLYDKTVLVSHIVLARDTRTRNSFLWLLAQLSAIPYKINMIQKGNYSPDEYTDYSEHK